MKKFYTTLLAALGLFTAATAQTAADLAGNYTLTCSTPLLTPAIEGVELGNTYSVTITASETAADSVYMDGFLGEIVDADFEPSPLGGKYDATAKTITFTQQEGQLIVDPMTYATITLDAPVVLKVATDDEGNITLTPQSADGLTFSFLLEGEDESENQTSKGLIETFGLTKDKVYEISAADLVGTYSFNYETLDPETWMEGQPGTSTFTVTGDADGNLSFGGLLGMTRTLPINYTATGFTIDPVAEEKDGVAFQFASQQNMGAVEVAYGENGSLIFKNGLVLLDSKAGVNVIITSGTAAKTTTDAITNVTTATAATAKAYSLQGVLVATGAAVKSLPAGLYIIDGQKVIVK